MHPADRAPSQWEALNEMGFSVFPLLHHSKRPATQWQVYQTRQPYMTEVAEWSRARPAFNIGLATGAVSGVVVLDLDDDAAILAAYERGVPETMTVRTPRGLHLYFRHPGGHVRNRAGLLPSVDLRGDGGYVVGPSSYFAPTPEEAAQGKVAGSYEWVSYGPVAPMPDWLAAMLIDTKPPTPPAPKPSNVVPLHRPGGYGNAAMLGELQRLREAAPGTRNHTLNRCAFALAQLAAAGEIEGDDAIDQLRATAAAIGLEDGEIEATLASGWGGGMASPRQRPDPAARFGAAPPPPPVAPEAPAPAGLPLIDTRNWQVTMTPEREWAVEGWLPHRQATYLTGAGSAGKSLLTQQLCTCIALGLPFMGVPTRQAVAVYVTCEDDADELHRRQKAICAALGVPIADIEGKLRLVSLVGGIGNELATFTPEGRMSVSDTYRALQRTAADTGAGFLALDNVAHLFTGNENIRNQVAAFCGLMNQLATEIDGAVLFLGHPNKAGDSFSGSTAWENQVRSRLTLTVPTSEDGVILDPDVRELKRGKANYARNGETIGFRWVAGAFVRHEDLASHQLADVQEARDEAVFMACLERATSDTRAVSHNPGTNFAPAVFAKMPEAQGVTRRRLEAALERLLQKGAIMLDQPLWRAPNRTMKQGIKAAAPPNNGGENIPGVCTDPPAPTPRTDPHRPPSQVIDFPCTDPHASTPLYTTYISGAGLDGPRPPGLPIDGAGGAA
ncbi:AAA family ATPase [Blastomonas sp. RAC04]|uniref:AAA family ATPase n=1 Tax=Blastomonas sp. RAC04 TaxID=1842535 RepID=UPI001495B28C|nr:AAA family ATPase [Blastomonas sp. RAC04]